MNVDNIKSKDSLYKDNTSIIIPVVFDFFFLPIVSVIYQINQILNPRVIYHNKGMGHSSKIAWGVMFIIWGITMTSQSFLGNNTATNTNITNISNIAEVRNADIDTTNNSVKPNKAVDEGVNIFLVLFYAIPCIISGILFLIYMLVLDNYNKKAKELDDYVQGGIKYIPEISAKLAVTNEFVIKMFNEMKYKGFFNKFKINLQTNNIERDESMIAGVERRKVNVVWVCKNCGASNNKEIYEGDTAVCDYCHTPRV